MPLDLHRQAYEHNHFSFFFIIFNSKEKKLCFYGCNWYLIVCCVGVRDLLTSLGFDLCFVKSTVEINQAKDIQRSAQNKCDCETHI